MSVETLSSRPNEVRQQPLQRSEGFMQFKRLVQACFKILVLPRLCIYRTACLLLGARAFLGASESISRVPGMRGVFLRQAFYRSTLAACGHDVYFGFNSVFSMREACVGERAYVGRFCSIGFADIGDSVMLADGVQILSGGQEHGRGDGANESKQNQMQTFRQVRIGRDVWIGAGAVVMADVGEGAIVGAGAVVNRPIPARTVAVGVPAEVVKHLDEINAP